MKRTNSQVKQFLLNSVRRHGYGEESLYTSLLNYWVKYDLTEYQTELMEEIKSL